MSKPVRLQSPFISETEVKKVVEYLVKNAEDEIPESIDMEAEKSKSAVFESFMKSGASEDDLYGIIVEVREKHRVGAVPLCDLNVMPKGARNFCPVKEYAVWFSNR